MVEILVMAKNWIYGPVLFATHLKMFSVQVKQVVAKIIKYI